MGDMVLRVTPEVLYQKSGEAGRQLSAMRESFRSMQDMVRASAYYWQGEAGELHRASYEQRAKEAEDIFKRLQEHVDELQVMASGYEKMEKKVQAKIEPLSENVIV